MDSAVLIYSRTARGNAELNARQSALDAAANSLLILIDGKRTRRELLAVAQRLGLLTDCLNRLETGGYIATQELRNQPLPPRADFEESLLSEAELHSLLYRNLVSAAKTHLGLKGFLFHIKIEKAVSIKDLQTLIEPLGEAIAKARGLTLATDFVQKMRLLSTP